METVKLDTTPRSDSAAVPRPLSILVLLICVAAFVGLAEAGYFVGRRSWTGELIWVAPRHLWMAPLAYAVLALGPALFLAACARIRPRASIVFLASGVGGVCMVGTVTLLRLLSQQRLHIAAMALVGAGLGWQAASFCWRHPACARVLIRRTALGTVAVTALLALFVEGRRVLAERSGHGRTAASEPSAGTTNVLFILLDTVRAFELSLYGFPLPTTPRLDSLAAHAVVFEHAFATTSWTLPSHASIFTGRFPHELRADWTRPLEPGVPTLAEVLRDLGFRTAGFVGNVYYVTHETGLNRGFSKFVDYPLTIKEVLLSAELVQLVQRQPLLRRHDNKRSGPLFSAFLRWQNGLDDRPFFAFLNLFDAHWPRYSPDSLRLAFAGVTGRGGEDRYMASIAHMDEQIGLLLDELRRRGVLDRTMVVITSDHGEEFERPGLTHGKSLYANVIRVPLMILLPGREGAGLRITQPVSLRNLGRTVLELANAGEGPAFPGTSLSRFWRAPDLSAEEQDALVLSELTPSLRARPPQRNALGEVRSLVRGQWHYIVNGNQSRELFDYWTDEAEQKNIAGSPMDARHDVFFMGDRLQRLDRVFPRVAALDR